MGFAYYLALAIFASVGLVACMTIERDVRVTPAPVPEEIEGAAWQNLPASYCIVRQEGAGFVSHERFVELTIRAFDVWGVPVVHEGDCPGEPEQGNGRNEVYWGSLGEAEGGGVNEAGRTQLLYRHAGNNGPAYIVEADIVIDSDPPGRLRNEDCLLTTLMHEAGHFFGIHHLETPALMAPVIQDCNPELTEADREAIDELYPDI
jgi:hypothetical protein